MAEEYRRRLLQEAVAGTARVVTDRLASPTGFPFKVAQLEGTLSEQDVYLSRARVCDLGYLREAYRKDDGRLGYRCSAEPRRELSSPRAARRRTRSAESASATR